MSIMLKKITVGFALIAVIALSVGLMLPENHPPREHIHRESQWMESVMRQGASDRFLDVLRSCDQANLFEVKPKLTPSSSTRWELGSKIRKLTNDEIEQLKVQLTDQELYFLRFQGKGIYVPDYLLCLNHGDEQVFISWSQESGQLELGDGQNSFILNVAFSLPGGVQ